MITEYNKPIERTKRNEAIVFLAISNSVYNRPSARDRTPEQNEHIVKMLLTDYFESEILDRSAINQHIINVLLGILDGTVEIYY